MALNPVAVVDTVIKEYRSHLQTEFRARDPELRDALTQALDAAGCLAQEPFFQAHRPIKAGKAWRFLELDTRLVGVLETATSQ